MIGKFSEKDVDILLKELKVVNPGIEKDLEGFSFNECELIGYDKIQSIFDGAETREVAHGRVKKIVMNGMRPISSLTVAEVMDAINNFKK